MGHKVINSDIVGTFSPINFKDFKKVFLRQKSDQSEANKILICALGLFVSLAG